MKKGIWFVAILMGFSPSAYTQEIQVNADPAIEQLFKTWINLNRSNPHIQGWRIQIFSSTDRQQVDSGKAQFLNTYPNITADWVHEKPYYKLRVGAFRTRQEAMSFLAEIKDSYPGAYPAKDPNIHPRDFLE